MGGQAYYTLVASLPHLPHFERAERLPITRKRLDERLTMLELQDADALAAAESLVGWHQPLHRTTSELLDRYRHFGESAAEPSLRAFVDLRMDQRTIVAALRLRHMGAARHRPPWGVGRWVPWIEDHWDDPDLGLGAAYPWLPVVREGLAREDALGVERILFDVVWKALTRVADANPFGFEEVFAFVFRWDILHRWLEQDSNAARTRFRALASEVAKDRHGLFD